METHVVWFIVGVALVIVELLTGTMFLLVLGVAAVTAALAAYTGLSFAVQVAVFAVAAAVMLVLVQRRRRGEPGAAAPPLEIGQPVNFEGWIDRDRRLARVRFRGTLWNADVAGDCAGESGEVLYVKAVNGSTLVIAKAA
jgi:membrane protein implicated in regulation of membrane protease activity